MAVGQALGYNYQFDRATYRLLQADSAVVSVGVEHIDDVSVHHADGSTINEQDKATTAEGAPLSDRSVALWKTLGIWTELAIHETAGLAGREFHLVTNGTVSPNGLAARIHAAVDAPDTDTVAAELQALASTLRVGLEQYASPVVSASPELVAALVARIFVFDRVAAAFGGNLDELPSLRLLGDLQRQAVFDHASGWVRRAVLAAAQAGEPTLIDRAEFDREVRALFRRVSVAPLTILFDDPAATVDPAKYCSHGFFQQLEWVDLELGFVRDCVIHYVQAKATRVKWTDAGEVSESSLRAYEDDLRTRWTLAKMRQAHRVFQSPVDQGQALLAETLSEDTALDGQPMPKAITCGSYHALADFDRLTEPQVGWHPDFKQMADAAKGRL